MSKLGLNARDTRTVRRLIDYYGHTAVLVAIADYYDVQSVSEHYDNPPTTPRSLVSKRWCKRAANLFRHAAFSLTRGVNGNIESQPEYDNLPPFVL